MQQGKMSGQTRRLALLSLVTGLGGCYSTLRQEYEKKLTDLKAEMNGKLWAIEKRIDREKAQREAETQRIASRVECHNEKVKEFLKECEEGSDVCSEQGVANASRFITTQPFVTIYLRPQEGVKGLVQTRIGQLRTLGDSKTLLPSTRFLVLLLPRSDSAAHRDEALRSGREIQRYLVNDLFRDEKELKMLGPKLLPCKMKKEELAFYFRGKLDAPVKGEPTGHEPTVRIYVFKTDC